MHVPSDPGQNGVSETETADRGMIGAFEFPFCEEEFRPIRISWRVSSSGET